MSYPFHPKITQIKVNDVSAREPSSGQRLSLETKSKCPRLQTTNTKNVYNRDKRKNKNSILILKILASLWSK